LAGAADDAEGDPGRSDGGKQMLISNVLEESSLLPVDIVIDLASRNRRKKKKKLDSFTEAIAGYIYECPERDGFTVGSK